MYHLLKRKKEFKNLKRQDIQNIFTGYTKYILNEQDKACFQLGMAFGDFKDLARRTASDKFLRNKTYNIAKYPKYDGYQRALASMAYQFFDEKCKRGFSNNEAIS